LLQRKTWDFALLSLGVQSESITSQSDVLRFIRGFEAMPNTHVWKEKDDEGRKREVRATKFGGAWRLQAKLADEESWTYYELPLLEDLRTLRDLIERKYRRRRASAEDLAAVEKLLKEREEEER
jgi:hypothetical protein